MRAHQENCGNVRGIVYCYEGVFNVGVRDVWGLPVVESVVVRLIHVISPLAEMAGRVVPLHCPHINEYAEVSA